MSETCTVDRLKPGDWVTCHERYEVASVGNGRVNLKTPSGSQSMVACSIIKNEFHSASNFNKEEYVTLTTLRSLLNDATGMFTVCYEKSMKTPDGVKKLDAKVKAALDDGTLADTKKRKRFLLNEMHGEIRVMTCNHMRDPKTNERLKPEHGGLLPVWDSANNGKRTVDPRSVQWLIWEEVKYIAGKPPKKKKVESGDSSA